MDETRLTEVLDAAERAAERGDPLGPTGFWRVVAALKRVPELRDRYAARVAAIDAKAFRHWAVGPMPLVLGVFLAVAVTVGALVLVGISFGLDEPANWLVFLAGTAILLGSTHALAHYVVGRLLGIRFTAFFVKPRGRLQPGGVKIDYASYLAAPAGRRAWMHASGAVVTKAIPFIMIGPALAAGLPRWVPWALFVSGTIQLIVDVLLSGRYSDWKRFRRERALARGE